MSWGNLPEWLAIGLALTPKPWRSCLASLLRFERAQLFFAFLMVAEQWQVSSWREQPIWSLRLLTGTVWRQCRWFTVVNIVTPWECFRDRMAVA